jgi:DNA polymerase-3 subunit epsilon
VTKTLAELDVLILDCQAGGATPAYGDLLEIGWAVCGADALRSPVRQHFVVPRTNRRVPAAVRELTGWSEACIAESLPEQAVWAALRADVDAVAASHGVPLPVPTAIHYARFELGFLRDLHARLDSDGVFPLEPICLHAIAARLFPELPRRSIRALAGYLGHSTELLRRCAGHVEASAFIWRAFLPRLEAVGVRTLDELWAWLEQRAPARASKRVFPYDNSKRRALPDAPGVYRFLRSNGDVLYVGKATSIKKRIASHFSARTSRGSRRDSTATTERALELLTQVQEIAVTPTASILEAALLESDEIKRIDPPYNVQLRSGERCAWFARADYSAAAPAPDALHSVGPLPSERALLGLYALIALANGETKSPGLQACALAVPASFLPSEELFGEGFVSFARQHLSTAFSSARLRVEHGARALWLARGRSEIEAAEELAPDAWDLARVVRRLERSLTHGSLLVRRARWLRLLSFAQIAFRERAMPMARVLVVEAAEVVAQRDLPAVSDLSALPVVRLPSREQRKACFAANGANVYDRMRVLATELNRVHADGGELAIRFGSRRLEAERIARILRWV